MGFDERIDAIRAQRGRRTAKQRADAALRAAERTHLAEQALALLPELDEAIARLRARADELIAWRLASDPASSSAVAVRWRLRSGELVSRDPRYDVRYASWRARRRAEREWSGRRFDGWFVHSPGSSGRRLHDETIGLTIPTAGEPMVHRLRQPPTPVSEYAAGGMWEWSQIETDRMRTEHAVDAIADWLDTLARQLLALDKRNA